MWIRINTVIWPSYECILTFIMKETAKPPFLLGKVFVMWALPSGRGVAPAGDFTVVFVHPEGTLFSLVSQRPDLHFAGFNLRSQGAVL